MNGRITLRKTPMRIPQHRAPASEVNSIVISFDDHGNQPESMSPFENKKSDLSDDENNDTDDDDKSQFSLISNNNFREIIDHMADMDAKSTTGHDEQSSFFISTLPGYQTPQKGLVLEIIQKNNELQLNIDEIKNLRNQFKKLAIEKSELLEKYGPVICCATKPVKSRPDGSAIIVNSSPEYLTLKKVTKNVCRSSVCIDEFFQTLEILQNLQQVKKLIENYESCLSILDSSTGSTKSPEVEDTCSDSVDYSTILASLIIQKLNFIAKDHYLLRETKFIPKDNPRILECLQTYEALLKIRQASKALQSELDYLTRNAKEIHATLLILYRKLSNFADRLSIKTIVTETCRITRKYTTSGPDDTSVISLEDALRILASSIKKTLFANASSPTLTLPKLCSPSFFAELLDLTRAEISYKNSLPMNNNMWILKKIK